MANYAAQLIKTVYPYAVISMRPAGQTSNVITYLNNMPIWNIQKDGGFDRQNVAVAYVMRIRKALEGY